MSDKPLRSLGVEIDILAQDAINELADWNQEIRDSLGVTEDMIEIVNEVSQDMLDYAQTLGISKDQLVQLKDNARRNSEIEMFSQKVGVSAQEVKKLADEAENAKGKMSALKGAIAGVAALGIGKFFKSVGGQMLDLASQAEKTKISFESMLGSQQHAKEAIDMLNEITDKGIFSQAETNAAGKRLLGLKMPINEVQKTLTELGNIAAGSEMSLESLADMYSKNKTMGIVQMNDIKQLSAQGIPIFEELGKVLGLNSTNSEELSKQIREMSKNGTIHFDHLSMAFSNMSQEGGAYAGVMDRMSMSAAALSTTFNNKLSSIKASLGEVLALGLKPLLIAGIAFLDWLLNSPRAMMILRMSLIVIIPLIGTLFAAALVVATKAVWGLVAAKKALIIASFKLLAPFVLIGIAILGLILIIEDLYHFFTGGESLIGEWVAGMLNKVKWIPEAFKKFFFAIPAFIRTTFSRVTNTIRGWFTSTIQMFKKYGKYLIMAMLPVSILFFYWDEISSFLKSIPSKIVDIFSSIPGKLKGAFSNIKKSLEGMLPDWVIKIISKNSGDEQAQSSIEARASGGPVSSGQTYLVGEKGPELFTPRGSGTITPNHALGKGGGSGKNINITIAPVINITSSANPETIAEYVIRKIEGLIPFIEAELGLET